VTWSDVLWILALIPVAFIQNMVFTAVSRSRNSGDPQYHRWWAYGSNSVWLLCQVFIWKGFWGAFNDADYLTMVVMAFVYIVSTTEGSVVMMRRMLKTETGARKVGANPNEVKVQQIEVDMATLKKRITELEECW